MGIWHLGVVLFFLIFFVFINQPKNPVWNYDWTGIRSEIRDSTMIINDMGELWIGLSSDFKPVKHREDQLRICKWISKNATQEELKLLIDFPNSGVKTAVYLGLLKKENQDNFHLIERLLNDTTHFYNDQSGSMSYTGLISEYVFSRRLGYPSSHLDFKDRTVEGFKRLCINQEKMNILLVIYEKQIARREEIIMAAERNYLFFD